MRYEIKWIFIHVDYLPFTMQRKHLFAFLSLQSSVQSSPNKEGCIFCGCGCVGGKGRLLQTETMDLHFSYRFLWKLSSLNAAKWIDVYELDISPNINNIEFQEDDAIRVSTKSRAETKFIYRTRKNVDTGKFICLLRPTNGWLHLQLDCAQERIKANFGRKKDMRRYLHKELSAFGC